MRPTPAQTNALWLAKTDPMGVIIRPDPGKFWIRNGQEQQLWDSDGPETDPPSVPNAIALACWRAGWLEPVRSMLEDDKAPPRRLRITDAGRQALAPEWTGLGK